MTLAFVHTVRIEQQPDGSTLVTQETHKEGQGQASPQMRAVMEDYYLAYAQFMGSRESSPATHTTAEWGRTAVAGIAPALEVVEGEFYWD